MASNLKKINDVDKDLFKNEDDNKDNEENINYFMENKVPALKNLNQKIFLNIHDHSSELSYIDSRLISMPLLKNKSHKNEQVNHLFRIGTTNYDGITIYEIIIWKLRIAWS